MNKKDRALQAIEALKKLYPDAVCSLRSDNPLQLLIATRLSAQCTDARVNLVTPALFAQFPTLEAFAEATPEQVGEYIHSCGLYKTKARDIVAMCTMLRDTYGGAIPNTVEELIKLPGVGRKTANLVCGDVYRKARRGRGYPLISRISGRLGLTDGNQGPLQSGAAAEKAAAAGGKQRLLPPGWCCSGGISAAPAPPTVPIVRWLKHVPERQSCKAYTLYAERCSRAASTR